MQDGHFLAPRQRRRIDRPDLVAGLVVIALSFLFGVLALGYGFGTPRQMGAGFFPLTLCALGGLLGAALAAKSVLRPEPGFERPDLRRFLFVSAAFLVFGLGIEPAGLFVTLVATTLIASLAHRDAKVVESLALGAALAVAVWVVFVLLLGLPIPLWPAAR
ncbi:tripartite tricarboxylate transporter TctB family protein [Aureimonas populi]|uniref:Tripartite tricarboxylate transporter TctB family protein n=1 Tax=Aureimonas populi TaxID=1701758 RepID=A0ABW5CKH5_9HYPH|nr:tripartite tricarboxylate transporter TctB family protein [Aureimonas populi]